MNRHVLVSLLKSVVLLDVMKVIPPDDYGPLHLHSCDDAGQDTATDVYVAGEGTLLVDVVAISCLKRIGE